MTEIKASVQMKVDICCGRCRQLFSVNVIKSEAHSLCPFCQASYSIVWGGNVAVSGAWTESFVGKPLDKPAQQPPDAAGGEQ